MHLFTKHTVNTELSPCRNLGLLVEFRALKHPYTTEVKTKSKSVIDKMYISHL